MAYIISGNKVKTTSRLQQQLEAVPIVYMNGERRQERTIAITASVDKESINIPDPQTQTPTCALASCVKVQLRLLRLLLPRLPPPPRRGQPRSAPASRRPPRPPGTRRSRLRSGRRPRRRRGCASCPRPTMVRSSRGRPRTPRLHPLRPRRRSRRPVTPTRISPHGSSTYSTHTERATR